MPEHLPGVVGNLQNTPREFECVKIRLIDLNGCAAVLFNDGDIILQSSPLSAFLMHLSILMPNCDLPDKLEIGIAGQLEELVKENHSLHELVKGEKWIK